MVDLMRSPNSLATSLDCTNWSTEEVTISSTSWRVNNKGDEVGTGEIDEQVGDSLSLVLLFMVSMFTIRWDVLLLDWLEEKANLLLLFIAEPLELQVVLVSFMDNEWVVEVEGLLLSLEEAAAGGGDSDDNDVGCCVDVTADCSEDDENGEWLIITAAVAVEAAVDAIIQRSKTERKD